MLPQDKKTAAASKNTSKFHRGKGRHLLLIVGVTLFLTSCFGLYRQSAQKKFEQKVSRGEQYDAIIVPGIPYHKNWGFLMKSRVLWSWILYKNGVTRNIIYSGGAVHSPYCEAKVMGLYAQQLGVPRENIFYDTLAKHSTENVYYSYLLAIDNGFKKVALATDCYQGYFLQKFVKERFAGGIAELPVVRDSVKNYMHLEVQIDPTPALVRNPEKFIPLTQHEGYFRRMKGTLGRNIQWQQHYKGKVGPFWTSF